MVAGTTVMATDIVTVPNPNIEGKQPTTAVADTEQLRMAKHIVAATDTMEPAAYTA